MSAAERLNGEEKVECIVVRLGAFCSRTIKTVFPFLLFKQHHEDRSISFTLLLNDRSSEPGRRKASGKGKFFLATITCVDPK